MHSFSLDIVSLNASESREQNSSVTTIDSIDTVHDTIASCKSAKASVQKLLSSHSES
jgi:hypothetical protein